MRHSPQSFPALEVELSGKVASVWETHLVLLSEPWWTQWCLTMQRMLQGTGAAIALVLHQLPSAAYLHGSDYHEWITWKGSFESVCCCDSEQLGIACSVLAIIRRALFASWGSAKTGTDKMPAGDLRLKKAKVWGSRFLLFSCSPTWIHGMENQNRNHEAVL